MRNVKHLYPGYYCNPSDGFLDSVSCLSSMFEISNDWLKTGNSDIKKNLANGLYEKCASGRCWKSGECERSVKS